MAKTAIRFNLDPRLVYVLYEQQAGKCAMCGSESRGFHGALHLDHDHETGEARGFLCGYCNTALGQFEDSVVLLKRAIDYLEHPLAANLGPDVLPSPRSSAPGLTTHLQPPTG